MDDGSVSKPVMGQSRRLTTVVAADICGYSRLAEIDDEAAIRTIHIVRAAFESVVAKRRGRLFHSSGDGFLAEFPSAADGVLAALDFVADIRARDSLSPTSPGAKVRAGVHSGDVMEQPGGDLLGHGVNIAARLQGEAEPNGVLVSQATVSLVRGGIDAQFHRRGALALKNIEEPVVAFEVEQLRKAEPRFRLANSIRRISRVSPGFAMFTLMGLAILIITGSTLQATMRREQQPVRTAPSDAQLLEDISQFSPGEKNYLDRQYLVAVMRTLAISQTDTSSAVLALLEAGNTLKAIDALKSQLNLDGLSVAKKLEINHQIGAIAELAAPGEAVAAYERILDLRPNDFFALARIGSALLAQDKIDRSRRHYGDALKQGISDERLLLQVKSDLAFAFALERNLPQAITAFKAIVERSAEIGFEEMETSARASLGIALTQSERFDEAREQYLAVLLVQPDSAFLASKARAAWGIAHIARLQDDLPLAERFYGRALDYETRANRAHGKASVMFGMALTDIAYARRAKAAANSEEETSRLARAENWLAKSFAIAQANDLVFHINMALVGFAQLSLLRGDKHASCEYISQSEALLNNHKVALSVVSPEVRRMTNETGCPFKIAKK